MNVLRDSYRGRVASAEIDVRLPPADFKALVTLRARVLRSQWWGKHEATPAASGTMTAGGRRWATGGCLDHEDIASMIYRKNPALHLLHALAHYTVAYDETRQLHGPEFARAYLVIVQRFLGREAKEDLMVAFATHKVKTRTWSPAAKEQAKQRYAERDLKSLLAELE